jgi:AcrR family transcriptional regulator
MPKVIPEYKELAKKKIINAAYSIFYKKGYHSSTMDDIANEVGVSKASLYSYFKSKEEILQIVTNQTLTESFNQFFEDYNSLEPLEEIYINMLKFLRALHLDFEITALSTHNESIRALNRDTYEKKLEKFIHFIELQQNMGNIQKDADASTIAQLLNAIYLDIAMQLIIGIKTTKVHESWKNSLTFVLEKNNYDKQKTLNKYFATK